MEQTLTEWADAFASFIQQGSPAADPAHDLEHVRRVVASAKKLADREGANMAVVLPAAWLHDCVIVPKNSPVRAQASRLAAGRALAYLRAVGYPAKHLDAIEHAIAAHSFSAGIPPRTLEARVVQDADRLDAIGAIGIARCLMLGGALGRPLYEPEDPFCSERAPDDLAYTLDHFYAKLLGLADTMQTEAGKAEAARRTDFMIDYLDQLALEIGRLR